MIFTYNLGQCSDWKNLNCRLDPLESPDLGEDLVSQLREPTLVAFAAQVGGPGMGELVSQLRDMLIGEAIFAPREITEENPNHWHLHQQEGGDWIYKTRMGCLQKLMKEVNTNYDRLYDEQGNHRAS